MGDKACTEPQCLYKGALYCRADSSGFREHVNASLCSPKAESVNQIASIIFSGFRFAREEREIQKTLYQNKSRKLYFNLWYRFLTLSF